MGREVDAYRRFVELCQELVEVTEQICDLRPVEEPEEEALDQLKKKLHRKYSAKPRRR